jgi:hypothetical protein
MRKITPDSFEVYTLDELEPAAREKAVEGIAEKLGGDWWDSSDVEDVSDVLVYTLAEQFGTPGREKYGVGDFPGIPGVELRSWDLDRADYAALSGTLDRENAPALPWAAGIEVVSLTEGRDFTMIVVEFDDTLTDDDVTLANDAMEEAIHNAIHEAKRYGRAEIEHKTGAEWAEEVASGYEFHADGTLYVG